MDFFSFFLIVAHVLSVDLRGGELSLDLDTVDPRKTRPKLSEPAVRSPSGKTVAIRPPPDSVGALSDAALHRPGQITASARRPDVEQLLSSYGNAKSAESDRISNLFQKTGPWAEKSRASDHIQTQPEALPYVKTTPLEDSLSPSSAAAVEHHDLNRTEVPCSTTSAIAEAPVVAVRNSLTELTRAMAKGRFLTDLDFQLARSLDSKKYGVSEQVMDNKTMEGTSKHIFEDVTLAVDDGRRGFFHQLQYTNEFHGFKTEEFITFNSNVADTSATEQILKIYHASPRKDTRYIPVDILSAMLGYLWPSTKSKPLPNYICVYHNNVDKDRELIQMWRYAIHKEVGLLGSEQQRYRPIAEVKPIEGSREGFIVFELSSDNADFLELERLMLVGKLPRILLDHDVQV